MAGWKNHGLQGKLCFQQIQQIELEKKIIKSPSELGGHNTLVPRCKVLVNEALVDEDPRWAMIWIRDVPGPGNPQWTFSETTGIRLL